MKGTGISWRGCLMVSLVFEPEPAPFSSSSAPLRKPGAPAGQSGCTRGSLGPPRPKANFHRKNNNKTGVFLRVFSFLRWVYVWCCVRQWLYNVPQKENQSVILSVKLVAFILYHAHAEILKCADFLVNTETFHLYCLIVLGFLNIIWYLYDIYKRLS